MLDLQYLAYTSLDGAGRRDHMDSFLASYNATYNRIMKAAGRDAINLEEMKNEYQEKQKFGVLSGLMIIPMVTEDSDEVFDAEQFLNSSTERDQFKAQLLKKVRGNQLMKKRFLDMFDDVLSSKMIA